MLNKYKNQILYLLVLGGGIFCLIFIVTCSWIGNEMKTVCNQAFVKHPKESDCIMALTKVVADKNEPFKNRNDAVWTLGQIGDKRALPTLQKYYIGIIPKREPYNGVLSQYELKKSLEKINGAPNLGKVFWILQK